MFEKILIANRGEIACRIIRTARQMGIKTVAVYSDADKDALHVEMADEAEHIGPSPVSQSYLVVDKIVRACHKTKAQAVHPGYGFLSERSTFADRLKDEKIVFIGPNPLAIMAMGDKIESKKAAQKAGVATVPGFLGAIDTPEQAVEIADGIGYPVMIKASAGGGGKGMRVAYSPEEVREGYARARSEAKTSFGDDRVFIEKFIENPRHIEIQVLGDIFGNVIHLGERECSIQRRNQKVIEEAPSPFVDEDLRHAMGEQAVALARAVRYNSAGTVEFVVGQDRSFYFLEMNTRLQVEHPVTEMVTGVDLVEQMIRVAFGERLRLKQEDIRMKGWAVESRIYAEDPSRNFLPSTGRLVTYREPMAYDAPDAHLRIDTGIGEGGAVNMFYDPMLAKLVTHAQTRLEAIEAQGSALDAFYMDGIRPNTNFLSGLMRHPRWREGNLSTGFLAEEYPDGFAPKAPDGDLARIFVAVAAWIHHVLGERKRLISGQMGAFGSVPHSPERVVFLGKKQYAITVEEDHGEVSILFGDGEHGRVPIVSDWAPGEPVWRGGVGEYGNVAFQVSAILNGYHLAHAGCVADARVYTKREAELAALMPPPKIIDTGKFVLCPMPGLVKSLLVAEGQDVKAGDTLCVVEAMKMENVLKAEKDAVVSKLHAKEGDSLAVDAVILEMA